MVGMRRHLEQAERWIQRRERRLVAEGAGARRRLHLHTLGENVACMVCNLHSVGIVTDVVSE